MATITRNIGGKDRTFTILSAGQLETITYTVPNPSGEIIDIRGLDKWAKHVTGCEWFILESLRATDPTVKREDIAKWGSIQDRTALASELFALAFTSKEESPSPNG